MYLVHFELLQICYSRCPGIYVKVKQGICCNKFEVVVAQNEKILFGFSYSENIANFEAFTWNFSSSKNHEIVTCDV